MFFYCHPLVADSRQGAELCQVCVGDCVGRIPQQVWPTEEAELAKDYIIISPSADCPVPCVELGKLPPLEGV